MPKVWAEKGRDKTMATDEMKWLGAPPEIPEAEIDHIETADVIVVGAGIAGVAAVRSAVEAGASVLLFEKCDGPQGRFGDFATLNCKTSAKWGRDNIDTEAVVRDLMRDSCFRVDQRILKTWADHCGEDFDWLLEACPEVPVLDHTTQPVPEGAKCWVQPRRMPSPEPFVHESEYLPCYQTTAWIRPTLVPVLKGNLEKAAAEGTLVSHYATRVLKLLREGGGRVEGLIAKDADGKYIKALARKGVVLATGDYSSNREMTHYYVPWTDGVSNFWIGNDHEGNPSNVGDGHKMGLWIGAKMQDGPHAPMIHHMGGAMGVDAFLQLNLNGERYMNEDCSGQQVENQLERQPQKTAWQFFDSAWKEQVPHMCPGHGSVCYALEDEDLKSGEINPAISAWEGYTTQGALDASVEKGQTVRADTIEELIDQVGLPREKALAEIARYNELARKGHDDDFGKRPDRLYPLEKGPFYAVKFEAGGMLVCMGGLESDREAHCFDTDRKPIPGLYVAGNVQGNRFAAEYSTTVPGLSHAMALTYGRIAGRNAALGV